jgi:hypothetical protein
VTVEVHGLHSAPELNGQTGVVRSYDSGKQLFVVELEGVGEKGLKPSNLRLPLHGSGGRFGDPEDGAVGSVSCPNSWHLATRK